MWEIVIDTVATRAVKWIVDSVGLLRVDVRKDELGVVLT